MQRYYFHVHDRWGDALDEEGIELPDLSAARAVAVKGARSLMCGEVKEGLLDLAGQVEVVDAAGVRLLMLEFSEAVDIVNLPRG